MGTTVVKTATKKMVKGRPSPILDDLTQSTLLDYVRLGVPIKKAVASVGIAEKTFYNWMTRGLNERERLQNVKDSKPIPTEGVYLQFLQLVERARGEAFVKKIAVVAKASNDGDWRAAAWWLERQAPEEFGKTDRIEHTGNNGDSIKISVEMGDLEDKIEKVLAMRKRSNE